MNAERLFLDHLDLIEQIIRSIAHRYRLTRDEADDLSSSAKLKIIESDYAVLRRFQGRSSLRTYLTAVIQRQFLDERIALWGRWRPSAQARRLGPTVVLLEQLVVRDHVELDAAIAQVLARAGDVASSEELRLIAQRFPRRTRRRFVSDEALADVPAMDSASDALDQRIHLDEWERTEQALASALTQLSIEDRLILKFRFQHSLQISQISKLTGLEQKPLYRRLEGIMKVLRRELEARGVTSEQIVAFIGNPAPQTEPLIEANAMEKPTDRPSL